MTWNLAEFASFVGGQLIGDASPVCTGANPPPQAAETDITLLDDPKRADSIVHSKAAAVVVDQEIESLERPQIVVNDPHQAFAKIVTHFRPPIDSVGEDAKPEIASSAAVHPTAVIGRGVTIGHRSLIGPGTVIMPRCKIGDDCVVHANTTLYEYTELSDRVIIHAGSVIGANGFGYRQQQGEHIPTSQLGYVAIESDVEVGAGVTIDRGTYSATRIGAGTKIDNQVQIGHNCQIGRHNLLCSQVGIAGSCTTGDYVVMAGQVGLADHVHCGDRTIIGAQAGVMDDLAGDQVYLGAPCKTQREQMQIFAVERKLPEMRRELKKLRRELEQLKGPSEGSGRRAA
jgi:UDP-3-O-[3-hydroxymyristoyl] glucosamine N-acyltransferase